MLELSSVSAIFAARYCNVLSTVVHLSAYMQACKRAVQEKEGDLMLKCNIE